MIIETGLSRRITKPACRRYGADFDWRSGRRFFRTGYPAAASARGRVTERAEPKLVRSAYLKVILKRSSSGSFMSANSHDCKHVF